MLVKARKNNNEVTNFVIGDWHLPEYEKRQIILRSYVTLEYQRNE